MEAKVEEAIITKSIDVLMQSDEEMGPAYESVFQSSHVHYTLINCSFVFVTSKIRLRISV